MVEPYDPVCERYAHEMEYLDFFKEDDETRADYVRHEEGTYNARNGHFLCDDCYIKKGQPLGVCP